VPHLHFHGCWQVLAPVAAIAYRVLEPMFGLSHAQAKSIHLGLLSAATFVGALGIADMWIVHARGAKGQIAKGWDVHFQSAHSWLGMLAFLLFVGNWSMHGRPVCHRQPRSVPTCASFTPPVHLPVEERSTASSVWA
jgi:hypothetical protein